MRGGHRAPPEAAAPQRLHAPSSRPRRRIAFFEYHNVFEDFYPHYGVGQREFASRWADTATHAWLSLVQREIGDVVWFMFSLAPTLDEARHEIVGCRVKFLTAPWVHRRLWRAFYGSRLAWRWPGAYRVYETVASYNVFLSWAWLRALLRERPDVIFVQEYATGRFDVLFLVARLLGVPLVAYHAGSRPEKYVGRWLRRWTLPRADRLFPSGRDELEMLAKRYGVPRERLTVLRPPVDMAVFKPVPRATACREAGLDPSRRYLLFVGRLDDRVKRVSAIVRAFAGAADGHPDADLRIVGDGPDRAALEALATELAPGRVLFTGWISDPLAKARLYSVAECLVLASWREGIPAVLSEAFACGTPVLASRVGALADLVIDGQTGWTFTAGDDEALREGLARVLSRPDLVVGMRGPVRECAERHVSREAVLAALEKGFSTAERRHG